MPRASVSVRSARTRRRGKKWSPVLVEIASAAITLNPGQTTFGGVSICENSNNTQTAPTATVIKVGNTKLSFECETGNGRTYAVSGQMYLMFVPQGLTPSIDYPAQHPEYIMAWRSFNPAGGISAVTIQSRLKRNLNSGDKIIIFYKMKNDDTDTTINCLIRGVATYVCCAN